MSAEKRNAANQTNGKKKLAHRPDTAQGHGRRLQTSDLQSDAHFLAERTQSSIGPLRIHGRGTTGGAEAHAPARKSVLSRRADDQDERVTAPGLSEWIGDAGSLRDIASTGKIFVETPRLLDAASSASSVPCWGRRGPSDAQVACADDADAADAKATLSRDYFV
jgi:hypothetical protein